MKKYSVFCATLCVAIAFTGCKSSESAYKKAYEKAKAQESAQTVDPAATETPVVAPVEEVGATEVKIVDNANDNVRVREEKVQLVNGSGLKAYSVVVGSYSVLPNAEGEQKRLRDAGYDAQLVKNDTGEKITYRVVAATFDNKSEAINSRTQLRAKYPDAWLLMAR